MSAVAPLAYRSVLAHLLPGVVALYPLSAYVPAIGVVWKDVHSENSGLEHMAYLAAAALIAGLFMDAIRYISIDLLLNRLFYGKDSMRYVRKMQSETDLKFYEAVNDTGYAFYQFYVNTAIAILLTVGLWLTEKLQPVSGGIIGSSIVAVIVLTGAGIRATRNSARRMSYRFSEDKE